MQALVAEIKKPVEPVFPTLTNRNLTDSLATLERPSGRHRTDAINERLETLQGDLIRLHCFLKSIPTNSSVTSLSSHKRIEKALANVTTRLENDLCACFKDLWRDAPDTQTKNARLSVLKDVSKQIGEIGDVASTFFRSSGWVRELWYLRPVEPWYYITQYNLGRHRESWHPLERVLDRVVHPLAMTPLKFAVSLFDKAAGFCYKTIGGVFRGPGKDENPWSQLRAESMSAWAGKVDTFSRVTKTISHFTEHAQNISIADQAALIQSAKSEFARALYHGDDADFETSAVKDNLHASEQAAAGAHFLCGRFLDETSWSLSTLSFTDGGCRD